MRNRLTIAATAFAVILAVGAAPAALAQQGGPPPGPPRGGPGGPGGPMALMLPPGLTMAMPRGMRDLDLTDSQRQQIRANMDDFRTAQQSSMRQLHILSTKERAATQTTSFDSAAAQSLAASEVGLGDDLVVAAQQNQAKIASTILTADQRSDLADQSTGQGPPSPPEPPSPTSMASRLADRLGLSSAQQSKVEAVLAGRQSDMQSDRAKLGAIWKPYMKANAAGATDTDALNTALTQSKPIQEDAIVTRIKDGSAIWSILTADQRTQFAQMMPRGGPGGPGGPGRGFGPPPGGGFAQPGGGGPGGGDGPGPGGPGGPPADGVPGF